MRILLYGINFAPELTGIGKYTGEMGAWLSAQGHEVRVVTAPPYYPEWKIDPAYNGREHKVSVWRGVKVWRAPLWVPRRPSGAKRLLHLASFAICSLPLMLRQVSWQPDVVWVVEPPLFCAPAAVLVARLTGARAWLHVQDYEVDAAFELGLLKGKLPRRLISAVERWIMLRFDRVSTISDSMITLACKKGVKPDRLTYFPNWIDLEAITPVAGPSPYRAELGIPEDTVVALYSGNMGGKQGLEIMAEAARLLADEPMLHLVFCGNGAGKEELVRQCLGLKNVHFMDLQPFERLNDLLGMADIHLLPQRADAADLVMPSKLTGMLASGRAVVATAGAETGLGKVVRQCGVVVAPGDSEAFAKAIRMLACDSVRRQALGQAGRIYAESHFGKDAILTLFADEMKRICRGR
jgi:colanic acid biosynthesis glycosyl transferase WcaI